MSPSLADFSFLEPVEFDDPGLDSIEFEGYLKRSEIEHTQVEDDSQNVWLSDLGSVDSDYGFRDDGLTILEGADISTQRFDTPWYIPVSRSYCARPSMIYFYHC